MNSSALKTNANSRDIYSKDKAPQVKLELWLERNLRERARNSRMGSEERINIFIEMLKKIADSDQIFGSLVEKALNDLQKERETSPSEIQALQRLMALEKKVDELKTEVEVVERENERAKQQSQEMQNQINIKQKEIKDLEAYIRQKSELFEDYRNIDNDLSNLFVMLDEPITPKTEEKSADAPQIITLRTHVQSLQGKIEALKKNIQIAEDEIEILNSSK
ncbi:hypothetical protein GPJ56_007726 [Histomonas meleagridis]|uniref:uncharacterized protein n=1 Tax=Histomonas meleagridis TaxID=135588 RepID=UPI00355A3D09|nr:hypothetical protein GPJ56_007726 [Histomonas meleagridis]KAH0801552.1 hypothetical protein GO595_005688 [Histomonas meleagridis]